MQSASADFRPHGESTTTDGASTASRLPPPDPVYTFRPHAGEITALTYVNLGSRGALAAGTSSGQLSLWDLSNNRQTWIETCSNPLIGVDSKLDGKLVSQCRNNTVNLWNLETHCKDCSLLIEKCGFCTLSMLGEEGGGSTLNSTCFAVSSSKYGKVNLYDLSAQKLVSTLTVKEPKSKGMCMCVNMYCGPHAGVVYVLGGFEDGSVVLWDCRNYSEEVTSLKLFTEPAMCLAFDKSRSRGVCGSPLNTLEVFSAEEELQKEYCIELKNAGVADVAVRQDSKILASGGWDGRVRVFGWKKGKSLAILNYHSATVNCICFAGLSTLPEHSNLMACGSKDERISLWRLY